MYYLKKLICMYVCVCVCVCVFTWQGRSQAMRGPAGGDAPDDAVKQETDLLSFWTGQEENTSPWKMDGERDRQHYQWERDINIWWMTQKNGDGIEKKKNVENCKITKLNSMTQ